MVRMYTQYTWQQSTILVPCPSEWGLLWKEKLESLELIPHNTPIVIGKQYFGRDWRNYHCHKNLERSRDSDSYYICIKYFYVIRATAWRALENDWLLQIWSDCDVPCGCSFRCILTGTGHHPSTCPATNDLANAFFYNQSGAVCIYIAEPKLYLLLHFMKHHIFFTLIILQC